MARVFKVTRPATFRRTLVGILVGAGLFLLGVSLAVTVNRLRQPAPPLVRQVPPNSDPAQVVRAYWELSAEGKAGEAAKLLTRSTTHGFGKPGEPPNVLGDVIKIKKLKLLKVESVIVNDREATVVVSASSELLNNYPVTFSHTLYQLNGEWKIFS